MADSTINLIKQIQASPIGEQTVGEVYDIAAKYDAEGNEIAKTYLPLTGGTMTGEISIGQGDGKGIQLGTDGRINATYTKDGATSTTATLLGAISGSTTVGHSEFQLKLRGKDGDSTGPTYNNTKVILESNLAGTTAGVVKQDSTGHVDINNGIITVRNDSHNHSLTGTNATISDWPSVRTALVEEWQGYTDTAISGLINKAPATLDTLKEIADFLKDEKVADGLVDLLGRKVNKSGDTMTGPLAIEHEGESPNPYLKLQTKHTTDSTLDRIWYVQSWKGPSDSKPYLYIGGSASGTGNPIKISDDGKLTTSNSFSANKGVFTVSDTTIGSDGARVKISTSNGGAVYFGTEGANNGTMVRFDQTDGTCRLKFHASATAGAMVWEQPEAGAKLHIDLGKEGEDKKRVTFQPNSTRIEANLDITGNATTASSATKLGTARTLSISSTAGGTAPSFDGTAGAALTIPKTISGFDRITSKEFVGDLTGNAATANQLALYTPTAASGTNSTQASSWAGGVSAEEIKAIVWRQAWKNSDITTDTGDLVLGLRPGQYTSNSTELCMMIDGDYYAMGQKVLHSGNIQRTVAPMYQYGTNDIGVGADLPTGTLYFVYE